MSNQSLEEVFQEFESLFASSEKLVRVVLSGRRRNMQTEHERIDLRPVLLKEVLHIQVAYSDGRAMTTKNFLPDKTPFSQYLRSGYANVLLEHTAGSVSLRITKKGEPLVHRTQEAKEQHLDHDRSKTRLLVPTLNAAISAGHIPSPTSSNPLTIVDLGCGHAYLTFAAHQYLRKQGIPVSVIGIDVRIDSRDRNNEIAKKLGIDKSIEFRAEEIADTQLKSAHVAIALHACDTATDDAIAWCINSGAQLALIAPCCHHDVQAQMHEIPEPWSMLTRHGIMKERLGDLLTDALRMQIMKLRGYRVEAIEFVGGEHTPRNLMIRAVKTGAAPDAAEQKRYDEMIALWKVKPALASLINH